MDSLKNKKILITAGPTWVPIDDVRVISNTSSGELGLLLAREALKYKAKVDLFLGPVPQAVLLNKNIRISRFEYFSELMDMVVLALRSKKYDYIFHCAAVSDYVTKKISGKISSENNELVVRLKRAPKIIDMIRKMNPDAFLVMFKLEGAVKDPVLLKRALEAMNKVGADLVVANRFLSFKRRSKVSVREDKRYRGFILGPCGIFARALSRKALAVELLKLINKAN